MAGLVKLNDPAGELSANYALQRQQQKKDVYVAIGAAEFRIWDAIRASKQAKQQPETKKKVEKRSRRRSRRRRRRRGGKSTRLT